MPALVMEKKLTKGDRGIQVRLLQASLAKAGFNSGSLDSIFGEQTKKAVINFQMANQLMADGIVGTETWKTLNQYLMIRKGDRGELVKLLQEVLQKVGYNLGSADSIFGDKTEQAVKKFQQDNKLAADGIVGPITWDSLLTLTEKEKTTTSDFTLKYPITPKYLTKPSSRRPGTPVTAIRFIVAHDTGNDGSTALGNIHYYEDTHDTEQPASAHAFVDHTGIYECIPLTTGTPEKAYHVRGEVKTDNELFGANANDVAAGVELCFSDKKPGIDNNEAYKRYVWYMAYLCYKFKLDPNNKIVGHYVLDPSRRTDPVGALSKVGKTFDQFLEDVAKEYNDCLT